MNLPPLSPDPDRAERMRARCREQLARRHQPRVPREWLTITLERALAAGFAAIYLAAVSANALSVFGLF